MRGGWQGDKHRVEKTAAVCAADGSVSATVLAVARREHGSDLPLRDSRHFSTLWGG
jgi:hypothetical protein